MLSPIDLLHIKTSPVLIDLSRENNFQTVCQWCALAHGSNLIYNIQQCNQTCLKNSTVKLSEPGLLVLQFFLFFNALLASSSEMSPSNESRSSIYLLLI